MGLGVAGLGSGLRARSKFAAREGYNFAMPFLLRRLRVGIGLSRHFLGGQRAFFLKNLSITTVLDVGANVGQYAKQLRRLGYQGEIHSFEPGVEALTRLRAAAKNDPKWHIHELALSDHHGQQTLKTWSGSDSVWSSLRSPGEGLVARLGEPSESTIDATTLEQWMEGRKEIDPTKTLLKIDAQGAEREVLAGAGARLGDFSIIEFEAAIRAEYKGEATLPELLSIVEANGFVCCSIMTERFLPQAQGAFDVDVFVVRDHLVH